MKKDEAKQLMCPFQQNETTTIKCIADKCMAWTTNSEIEIDGTVTTADGHCELIHGISGNLSRIAYKIC